VWYGVAIGVVVLCALDVWSYSFISGTELRSASRFAFAVAVLQLCLTTWSRARATASHRRSSSNG